MEIESLNRKIDSIKEKKEDAIQVLSAFQSILVLLVFSVFILINCSVQQLQRQLKDAEDKYRQTQQNGMGNEVAWLVNIISLLS